LDFILERSTAPLSASSAEIRDGAFRVLVTLDIDPWPGYPQQNMQQFQISKTLHQVMEADL